MTRLLLTAAAVVTSVTSGRAADPALTEAEYVAVLRTVCPAPGEDTFALVPWLTSLWDAREQAARRGKPILLWEMDGHPLGCG